MDKRTTDEERQKRLVAALAYLFTPLIPFLILVTDMRRDAFLRLHASRALVSAVVVVVGLALVIYGMAQLLRDDFLWFILLPIVVLVPFIPACIWARRVYLYGDVRPPGITQLANRLFRTRSDVASR